MTISELIERLEALKAEHGDLPIYYAHESIDQMPDVYVGSACTVNPDSISDERLIFPVGVALIGGKYGL